MSLTPGTRLGPYEIVSAIGAGGMGEVYRARDTKLHRDVALKVLPAEFADDPERLARFTREAHTLATLNHPHIAHIHGLEDSAGLHALVMELVEGEDLSARIARGPIAIDDAIAIAKQIAEALEAAHEQGIVHRDLKPANVMIRTDGAVKVLDFGIAKAVARPSTASGGPPVPPTLASPTFAGVILGTAAYMSPEQARGGNVDKRTDIWAFGVVVYEMLTGQRLFEGDVADLLAAVLRQDVDWRKLPPETPPVVAQLLRRCIERDVRRRLRDIGEARVLLDGVTSVTVAAAPTIEAPRAARRLLVAGAVAAVLVAAVAGGVALWSQRPPAAEAAPFRLTTLLPAGVGIDPTTYPILAISHDGSTLAYTGVDRGATHLYVRRLNEFEARRLPETEAATAPFFSPDDAWIGFFARGALKRTPVGGGGVITLAPATGTGDVRGAVWTKDDTIVFSPDATGPLMVMPASGGAARAVSTLDRAKGERTHRWPALMPDHQTALFTVGSIAHPDDYDDAPIDAVDLKTGQRRRLLEGGRMARYAAATGDLLYVRGKVLYAVRVNPATLQVEGRPRPAVDGILGDPSTGSALYAVADHGTLAYMPGDPVSSLRRLAWSDASGRTTPIDLPPALYIEPRVSHDGRRIAYATIDSNSHVDIWVAEASGGAANKLTSGGVYRTPVWAPDGKRLFFVAYDPKTNVTLIQVRAADGSGEPRTIGTFDGRMHADDVSPDGSTLYLSGLSGATFGIYRGYRLAADGPPDTKPTAVNSDVAPEWNETVSPDGRWLAHMSGRTAIVVRSVADGVRRAHIPAVGGANPVWSPDGRSIFYLQGTDMMAIPFEPATGGTAGKPRLLFGGHPPIQFDSQRYYDVAPDGRFLVMRLNDDRRATAEVRVILNWFTDLRQAK